MTKSYFNLCTFLFSVGAPVAATGCSDGGDATTTANDGATGTTGGTNDPATGSGALPTGESVGTTGGGSSEGTDTGSTGDVETGSSEGTDTDSTDTGDPPGTTFDVEIVDLLETDFGAGDILLGMQVRNESVEFSFFPELALLITNAVLFEATVGVAESGVFSVEWPTLPDEATLPLTCADVNLVNDDGPTPNCVENPDDRYAQVNLVVFRDVNGNGVLDVIGPEGGAGVDEVLGGTRGSLFYVGQFDAEFIRDATLAEGFGDFDPVAFEPGWHTVVGELERTQDLCSDLFSEKEDGCQLVEDACAEGGGSATACNAEFLECMSPMSPEQRAECEISVDVPGYAVPMTLDADPNDGAFWMCETSVVPFSVVCDPAVDTLLEPLEDNCSEDGTSYTFVGFREWDAAAPCTLGVECAATIELPPGPVPKDWPCVVAG